MACYAEQAATTVREAFPSSVEELTLEKCLGRGFFGEVWRAKEKELFRAKEKAVASTGSARTFAVKKVKLSLVKENRLAEQLRREIQILHSLRHPRIIELYFDFNDGKTMYLGMEYAAGGSLFEKLTKAGKFSPEDASRYFLETCEALAYLHHLPEKVIHRDIKPENILLDLEDRVKLADFGWANMLESRKRDTFCGTLDYLPPEMIMGTGHDESADMWNMGVLLYEFMTGKSPFGASSKEATCRLIIAVDLRFPPDFDGIAKDLVAKLCKKKPADRLTATAAMEHRFVQQFAPQAASDAAPAADDHPALPGKPSHPAAAVPAQEAAACRAPAEAAQEDDGWGRLSVAARKLWSERERYSVEVERLLKAKQTTEESMMRLTEELEQQHDQIIKERRRREECERESAELEGQCEAAEAELALLRQKAGGLQGDAGRLDRSASGGLGWWGRRGRCAAAGSA